MAVRVRIPGERRKLVGTPRHSGGGVANPKGDTSARIYQTRAPRGVNHVLALFGNGSLCILRSSGESLTILCTSPVESILVSLVS